MTRTWFLPLAAAVLLFAGCNDDVTPIRTLLNDPAQWKDETVKIAGTVKASVGALDVGIYQVDDGTGSIYVVSKGSGAPREGAKVGVEGKLQSGYTIGTESLTVLVEEKRKTD